MKQIQLTPNQHLMTPIEKCYDLNLIPTPQHIENTIKFNHFLVGVALTITVLSIAIILNNHYSENRILYTKPVKTDEN